MAKTNTASLSSSSEPTSLTEHLSALLDGEAGSFEQRRVLDELKSDDSLRKKLSSYSLIGETMRSGQATTVTAGASFLAGIHEKIEAEESYHHVEVANDRSSGSWLRPAGGFALAASVAAVAVIGFQNYQQTTNRADVVTASIETNVLPKNKLSVEEMESAIVVSADKISTDVNKVALNDSSIYSEADSRTRLLLKRYVDTHMKHASSTTFVPSVRVIAYAD